MRFGSALQTPAFERVVWLLFALNVATALEAAFALRPLFQEGVHWFFTILNTGGPMVNFGRYADLLPQLPALVFSRYFPEQAHGTPLLLSFTLPYALQPAVLTLASVAYLAWRRRIELALPCLLSFALATQSSAPAAQMIVPQALGLFWLALFILLLEPRPKPLGLLVYGLLVLTLAMTHETAVICFALLAAISCLRLKDPLTRRGAQVTLALATVSIAWIVFRVVRPTGIRSASFLIHVFWPWDPFRKFAAAMSALFLFALWSPYGRHGGRLTSAIVVLVGALLTLALYGIEGGWRMFSPWPPSLPFAAASRTTATFQAMAIALVVAFLELRRRASPAFAGPARPVLLVIASLSLISSACHDHRTTDSWSKGLAVVWDLLAKNGPGCHVVDVPVPRYSWLDGAGTKMVPYYALCLQSRRLPDRAIFGRAQSGDDACRRLQTGHMVYLKDGPEEQLLCDHYLGCPIFD